MKTAHERLLKSLMKKARLLPELRRRGPRAPWIVEVEVISSRKMKALNRKHLGKNKTTDVLSFPTPEFFRSYGYLGDLMICHEVLKRQAREQGHSAETEMRVLIAHGLLHLLGFDHEKSVRASTEMRGYEAKLLGPKAARGLIHRSRSIEN